MVWKRVFLFVFRLTCTAALEGWSCTRVASAEESAHPVALTLERTLQIAEMHAPNVKMAQHALREAEALRIGAGIVLPSNPSLSMDFRPGVSAGWFNQPGYAATFNVPLEIGGAPGARIREAQRAAEFARSDLGAQRWRARAAAWAAYVRVRVAEQRLRLLSDSLESGERIVEACKNRANAGASGEIEQSLATAEVAQIQASIQDADGEFEQRIMGLRETLDIAPGQRLELVTPLGEPPPAPEESTLIARALARRPELVAIKDRISMLEATDERLRKEVFPRIGIYAGVDKAPDSAIFGLAGLSVELPVAQRNQGPRARTAAARMTEMDRHDIEARRIARNAIAESRSYAAQREELRVLTDSALPAAERTLHFVELGWSAGQFDVFRVTTAAREAARVRGLRLDALEAAWLARVALDYSVGGIDK